MTSNPVVQSQVEPDHKKDSAASPRRPRYWLHLLIVVFVIAAALGRFQSSKTKSGRAASA
jgi:hypothetical protein